jgi:hypothetical protein
MTFQVIINSAQSIEIDRRRLVGQSISRSQRIKTAQRLSAQPFILTVKPIPIFKYTETRFALEAVLNYDRNTECVIQLGATARLNYLTDYTGQLSLSDANALTISAFSSSTVTIGTLPAIGGSITTSTIILRAGDFIQPQNSRYPYVVTSDILRGSGSTAQGTVHRPLITSEGITVTGAMKVGTETTMVVVASDFPTYEIVQRDWARFTGDFTFVEKVI